ncbi:unnamed protein product [Dicrocoelium dendriticum]|nr:unnamed protein product [Dicrocoelium dendriticum]
MLRVLSIQSHVVHGYVGNRSAVFPLQLLGIEVDFINSVQFSNHTAYSCFKGQVLKADDLRELYSGLKANGLHRYTHVLTGYVGCPGFLEAVGDIVRDLKTENPNLRYYCDPVLGDSGELYVPAELIPVYQQKILPLADVILPNQFEAELLAGLSISDEESALACIHQLHSRFRVPTVVISSSEVSMSNGSDVKACSVIGYASRCTEPGLKCGDFEPSVCTNHLSVAGIDPTKYEQVRFRVPRLNYEFRGTGDLFSALTLARLESPTKTGHCPTSLADALQLVLRTMQAVLRRTLSSPSVFASANNPELPLELNLVQSVNDIISPPTTGDYVQQIGPTFRM